MQGKGQTDLTWLIRLHRDIWANHIHQQINKAYSNTKSSSSFSVTLRNNYTLITLSLEWFMVVIFPSHRPWIDLAGPKAAVAYEEWKIR